VIDKRVIERQIRKGKLDAQAYQRTLEGLPDVSDRVARDTDVERPRSHSVVAADPAASAPEEPSVGDEDEDEDEDDEDEDEDEDEDDEESAPEPSAG
jgi:hypothetical protein